jgi:hypothetical protein
MNAEEIKQRQEQAKARKNLQRENNKVVEEALLQPYRDSMPDLGARAADLQFFHDVHCGRTFAVLPPDADELRTAAMKLLGGGSEVVVNVGVGIAKLNRSAGDTYNRRVGRVIATSKLSTVAMKLAFSNITEGRQDFHLVLGNLRIVLQTEKKFCPKFVFATDHDHNH